MERMPCLVRVGDNVKKYKHLVLEKDQVTIGRSPEVTYCLLSVMISRCHVILKKTDDGSWTIIDNKSLNGVYLNDKKLVSQTPCQVKDGDIVQLGFPVKAGERAEFVYKFHSSLKIKRVRKDPTEEGFPAKKRLKNVPSSESENKVSNNVNEVGTDGPSCSSGSPYKSYRLKLEAYQQEHSNILGKYQKQLEEMQNILEKKEAEQREMKQMLEREQTEKESQAATLSKLKKKEAEMKHELLKKQLEMESEKTKMEGEMQKELERRLQERESELKENLAEQRAALVEEKILVEESLQQEMEKALEAKDKQLELKLIKQKEQLESVIHEKELKQKMLESQLQVTQAEKEKEKESTLRARQDVLLDFADLMETELQCSICNELFVQAASLNCSHAFCNLCIMQWMDLKKDCPVCRTKVTSHVRSIVLDSYIDKMVEHLSDTLKESRKELVATRKEEQAKWDAEHKTARGTARRPVVIITDDEDDSDEDDDNSSNMDSDEDDEPFYGGYGRCFSCDRRGHWANNCPY